MIGLIKNIFISISMIWESYPIIPIILIIYILSLFFYRIINKYQRNNSYKSSLFKIIYLKHNNSKKFCIFKILILFLKKKNIKKIEKKILK